MATDAGVDWLDEGEVSAEWAAPVGDPPRRSQVRGPLVYGGVLLAVALIVGGLYLAGGFGYRTDLLTPIEPGELIVTGPYELNFTEATVQAKADVDSGEVESWEVVVIGRARVTGDESMAPPVYGGDSIFAVRDLASGVVAEPNGVDIGDDPGGFGSYDRRNLTPGLPPTGYRVTFDLPPDYTPGPTLRLGVAELAFESKYLTSDEKAWDNTQHGFRLDLPARVLPPA